MKSEPIERSLLDELRSQHPSCDAYVYKSAARAGWDLFVRDSGGLVARAFVSAIPIAMQEYAQARKAFADIADVFETPSHWMAL